MASGRLLAASCLLLAAFAEIQTQTCGAGDECGIEDESSLLSLRASHFKQPKICTNRNGDEFECAPQDMCCGDICVAEGGKCCQNVNGNDFACGCDDECCGNACAAQGSKCCQPPGKPESEWYPVSKDSKCETSLLSEESSIGKPIHCTGATGNKFDCGHKSSCCGNLCAGPDSKCCKPGDNMDDWHPVGKDTECETSLLSEDKPTLVFGTPLSGYHNATLWVYYEAMAELGYTVKMITDYIHPILYPMFVGHGGTDAGCLEEGCADKCAESGLGNKSPCVDFVVDSNIPVNHATWLKDYTDTFDVMGTAFQDQFIGLFAPAYSGWKTIDDAAKADNAQKTIIGFKGGEEYDCATLYCPKCGDGNLPYITGPPLSTNGFDYKSYLCPKFEEKVAAKLEKKKNFIVLMWTPQVFGARFPELVPLDLQNYTYIIKPNVGKAQVRKTARHKFSDKAISVLGAVFIGTEDVKQMDAWSHGYNNDPEGPLCDYQSWNTACSHEAAKKWIKLHQDDGKNQGVWKTFFW